MAESNLDGLRQARTRLVAERMSFALRLNNPRHQADAISKILIDLQGGIDAIDKAIRDEEGNQPSVYESRGFVTL
ncbi:hypothetical protein [Methylorubrum extorquens]